ncbi:MAG: hypothetical protein H7069_04620 [Phormidesmis sp. FL-bin-119]|nr:hypothetical protein [Pedobacter sp.]
MANKQLMSRTCAEGHRYHKSSDCPTYPFCEQELKPGSGFLSLPGALARRDFENNGIKTTQALSQHPATELFSLHFMGKASIRTLRAVLTETDLNVKEK